MGRNWRKGLGGSSTDNLSKEYYSKGEQKNGLLAGSRRKLKKRVFIMGDLSPCFFVNGNDHGRGGNWCEREKISKAISSSGQRVSLRWFFHSMGKRAGSMGAAAVTYIHTHTHAHALIYVDGWQSVGVLFWLLPFSVKEEARSSAESEDGEKVLGGLRRKVVLWGSGKGELESWWTREVQCDCQAVSRAPPEILSHEFK